MKKLTSVAVKLVLLLPIGFIATLHAAPSDIYLMRHAEKQLSADADPGLSLCGLAQAQAMAQLLPHHLTMIYHSGYQRTLQTAQQVALTQPTTELRAYNARDLTSLAASIKQQQAAVLIVGHSNTTPELIQLLSQLPPPTITEQDYGVVYQLKQSAQGYLLSTLRIKTPTICSSSST